MAHLITRQDAAFYARNKPAWHGLGIVKENVSIADLRKAFDWYVSKEPLYTGRGEETTTFATIRTIVDDNGNEIERIILGDKLSEDYAVLQNAELLNVVEPLLDAGCAIETGITLNRGRRIVVVMRLPQDMQAGKNDVISRFIMITNDHTGEMSACVGFTPVRIECANMLAMAERDTRSQIIRIRHKGNVAWGVEQVGKMIDTANGQFLALGETIDALADTNIVQADLDKFVKKVFFPKFKENADTSGMTNEQKEEARKEADALLKMQNRINEIFQTEPSIVGATDTRGTAYGAWQATNFFLNHVQAIGQERRLHSIAFGEGKRKDMAALAAAKELVLAKR